MISIEEKDLRFYIAKSTQPNAGFGLFAAQEILKGDNLEVIGVSVERGSISDFCTSYANNFKFAADYADSYKEHIVPMGYGGMVNHANEKNNQNVEIKYIKKNGENICVYNFLKDVKKGSEILGDYGDEWRNIQNKTKEVTSEQVVDDKAEWDSFLNLGLYNLCKLKRYEEKDATN
jgi:SET domain-containing protein